jgi:hypothetical protein
MKTIRKFGLYELKWRLYKQPLFHSEHRDQGTVANKKKLRTAIHMIQKNFMSTRFMRTRSKESQPYRNTYIDDICIFSPPAAAPSR